MIYLASPYSHPDQAVRQERFNAAVDATAALMALGEVVVSPISHSHPIFEAHPETGASFDQWAALDYTLIMASRAIYVLDIPGWRESYGIGKELEFARAHKIPVALVDLHGHEIMPL